MRIGLLVALLLLAGCKTELFATVPEQEANEMVALLQERGLDAAKQLNKDGTDAILVEKQDFSAAVDTLKNAGYPKPEFASIGDVFKPSGLVASPLQEKARLLWALGQELSRTLCDIDGVVTARVQVVLPNDDLLARMPTASSASAFVMYRAGSDLDRLTPKIKELIATSVEGLTYDKVSVIMIEAPAARVMHPVPHEASAFPGVLVGLFVLLLGYFATNRARREWVTSSVRKLASKPTFPGGR